MAALADPAVRLVLAHGATSRPAAAAAGQVLAILAVGLPGFAAFLYYIRVYQAMQNTRSAFWLYVVENAINIVLAAALYRPGGVRGIAASVTIAYTVAAVLAAHRVNRRLPATQGLLGYTPSSALRRSVLISLPGAALGWVAWHAIPTSGDISALLQIVVASAVAAAAGGGALILLMSADQSRVGHRRRRRPARNGSKRRAEADGA
jgi:putative peptidoglycan lipid II flippase